MSNRIPESDSLSLVQHFDPPKSHVGGFGWMCGYSADADFLDMATERFMGVAHAQRAHLGRITLAIMLDPGNPVIAPIDAPGVAHLAIYGGLDRPFELLHAKVAVLGFRNQIDPDRWVVRLLVSTGNWTRQTLEQSLDLIWCLDVTSESIAAPDAETQQACSDINAARGLLSYLAEYFDHRLVDASAKGFPSETANAQGQLNSWLDRIGEHRRGPPRFFDNRKQSLLAQLPKCVERAGIRATCGYLAMGSGFYETASTGDTVPKVLQKIVTTLRDKGRITETCEIDVFVNSLGCQAVARSVQPMAEQGFTVRRAQSPPALFPKRGDRSLHAKFLFAANQRAGSNNCSSAWVYLGSGNLTGPGFDAKAGLGRGNLEAGVVFAPQGLCWYQKTGVAPTQVITNLLPLQWTENYDSDTELPGGGDMPVRLSVCVAAPVAWLNWVGLQSASELEGCLRLPETLTPNTEFDVLDEAGNACAVVDADFVWHGKRPRQVTVRWSGEGGNRRESILPVLDEFGRIAATALRSLDLNEVAWQLVQFPLPPDDESADTEESSDELGTVSAAPLLQAAQVRGDCDIRQMMELVETIAARQVSVSEADWQAWCVRLEQTLIRAKHSVSVRTFVELQINPLSPLREAPFRPVFAEADSNEPGKRYIGALQRIEKAWGTSDLALIGEA